jgi:hypothetical protein
VSTPQSENYGKYKTVSDLSEMVKPSEVSFEIINLWLETTSQNFKTEVVGGGRWLQVTASANVISDLLYIPNFNTYRHLSAPKYAFSFLPNNIQPNVVVVVVVVAI